ncbi:DUF2062 domain-containing protein [Actomonas aquatica]|uniref:DUF2062 domain-containing protein n=1 Tax=Actomonas aquatica TaxID=2866162 RepID=A0ABZ1C6P7_9BACT|nr:DUF2062 domain-containing protein [Opitutus sp. WL0086]WRQ87035.1 DUF2062 domain-containing protein [Opitutus sp. WL0086]
MDHDHHEHRKRRWARIRRVKALLRYTPRRARFHRYPVIGRFADVARKRAYLWSFRKEHVRPALYAGAIAALLPIMGVQVPVAFALALLLRSNVMILVGLQFITNPFTAAPLYYGTYQLGHWIILQSGFGVSTEVVPGDAGVPLEQTGGLDLHGPDELAWTQTLGTTFNSLVLGGVIAGALLGLILDIIWRNGVAQAEAHRVKVAERKRHSDSTPPVPPAE